MVQIGDTGAQRQGKLSGIQQVNRIAVLNVEYGIQLQPICLITRIMVNVPAMT